MKYISTLPNAGMTIGAINALMPVSLAKPGCPRKKYSLRNERDVV
jgi:hypothetical protein